MKIPVLKSGAVCILSAVSLFVAVICLSFPSALNGFVTHVLPWIIGICGIVTVGGLLINKIVSSQRLGSFGSFILLTILVSTLLIALTAFVMAQTYLIMQSYKATLGLPIDDIGTIIPIKLWTVICLHLATLLGTVCFLKHIIWPDVRNEPRSLRIFVPVFAGLAVWVIATGAVSAAFCLAYQDRTAARQHEIKIKIESLEKQLDKLKLKEAK